MKINSSKSVAVILMMLLTITSKGQKEQYSLKHLINVITPDVCNCLTKNNYEYSKGSRLHSNCLINSIKSHYKLYANTVENIYGDTSQATGNQAAKDIYELIDENLVNTCDLYYYSIVDYRIASLKKLTDANVDSTKEELFKLNQTKEDKRDREFYEKRAFCYFELLDFENVKNNLDSLDVLEKKSNWLSYWLRAQMAEYLKKYDEAIKYYNLYNIKGNNGVESTIYMLKRKIRNEGKNN